MLFIYILFLLNEQMTKAFSQMLKQSSSNNNLEILTSFYQTIKQEYIKATSFKNENLSLVNMSKYQIFIKRPAYYNYITNFKIKFLSLEMIPTQFDRSN